MDAKLCPCDPNLVAFIHRNDIWIHNIITEEERRLTYTNQGSPSHMEEPVSAGVASFIVQEEFDRYTGYWWQPNFSTDESMYYLIKAHQNFMEKYKSVILDTLILSILILKPKFPLIG